MKQIQLFVPKFRTNEILDEIRECCDKNWTGLGYKTLEIEKNWIDYSGFKNAHFLNSATSGLHLATKILKDFHNWDCGDEVITTPLTFVSTNHSILYEKLKPVFCDVDESLNLNPNEVIKKINKKTRALIFVGLGGNTKNYNEILEICKKNNIQFIFDAAHCAGTKCKKSMSQVGSDSDVAIFSFQAVKNLPTSDSGMICFKDEKLDKICRQYSWLGINKDTYERTNSKGNYKWDYEVNNLGFKYHGNSIIASMAKVGLKYLDEDNQIRRNLAANYIDLLGDIDNLNIVTHDNNILSSRHLFQIRVKERDKLMVYLNKNNIFPGVHYKNNLGYSIFKPYNNHDCDLSIEYANEIISLPMHCFLKKEHQEFISDKIKFFLNESYTNRI